MLLLAATIFILFFYLGRKRPVFALASLAALLPTYLLRFKIFGLPSTILEVIIWAIFFGWLSSVIPVKAGIQSLLLPRLQKIKYPLALFFVASVISVFAAPDFIKTLGLWRAFFLESILVFLLILAIIKDKNSFEKMILGLSVSAFYVSAVAVGQKFFGWPNPFLENPSRTASIFPQPNMLGLYLGPIIILCFGQLISNFKFSISNKISNFKFQISKIIYWTLIIILSFSAIIFAQSMGAIVGIVGGMAMFMLLWNKKTRLALIILTLLLATCYLLLPNNNLFLAAKNKLLFGAWSGIVRLQIWKESWAMLKDNWLWGAGLSGYAEKILPYHASREWMDVFQYPHNIIFNFWSELGILGLAAFLWLLERFGKLCYHLLKREKLFAATAMAAMITLIIHGLVDVPYFKNDLSILFWIIYAMPFIT